MCTPDSLVSPGAVNFLSECHNKDNSNANNDDADDGPKGLLVPRIVSCLFP